MIKRPPMSAVAQLATQKLGIDFSSMNLSDEDILKLMVAMQDGKLS